MALVHDFGSLAVLLHFDVLAYGGIGAEVERESDKQPEQHLPHYLEAPGEAVLVLLEYLDVVV